MPPNAPRGRGGAIRAPNARWTNAEIDSLVSQLKDAKDAGFLIFRRRHWNMCTIDCSNIILKPGVVEVGIFDRLGQGG
jgi:hypothetical protein